MQTREEIVEMILAMSADDRLAAILTTLAERYPLKMDMICGMIAVMAIFGKGLPPDEAAFIVEAFRDLSDEVERPLLMSKVLH